MPRPHPLAIVLTGGIASGKSTVAHLFSDLGIPIIDADQISRELVQPGSVFLDKVIDYFGKDYLIVEDNKNHLNRSKLRERIFNFPKDRAWLENLLHPEVYKIIRERIQERITKQTTHSIPYIICMIPLYFEAKKPDDMRFDKIIVIDAEEKLQISRLMQRDDMTELQAKNILKSQHGREARLKGADEIVTNNNDLSLLKAQVLKIDQKYRTSYN